MKNYFFDVSLKIKWSRFNWIKFCLNSKRPQANFSVPLAYFALIQDFNYQPITDWIFDEFRKYWMLTREDKEFTVDPVQILLGFWSGKILYDDKSCIFSRLIYALSGMFWFRTKHTPFGCVLIQRLIICSTVDNSNSRSDADSSVLHILWILDIML